MWFLPFPDLAGKAAAVERDLMSPVGCGNNPLQLKTCTESLGAKTRVLWRIGHGVLLNRALSKMAPAGAFPPSPPACQRALLTALEGLSQVFRRLRAR